MKRSDDLFDKMIKDKLKKEINKVPDNINKVIDACIEKINYRDRVNFRKASGICVVCLVGTLVVGMTMTAYAKDLPILSNIFKVFHEKTYENYDKYSSDLNVIKESNGLKVTINKVVYDSMELSIFYTIDSENPMKEEPYLVNPELKINGKPTSYGSSGTGKFLNDNKTYVGVLEYGIDYLSTVPKDIKKELAKDVYGGYVEVPDEFVLSYDIKEIGDMGGKDSVKGTWDFNIPVSSGKINGEVKEKDAKIDLSDIYKGTAIEKIVTTPINTSIQGVSDGTIVDLNFMVFDDKGRYIPVKIGGASSGYKDKDGKFKSYFSYNFKELYDDTKSLTFIPYASLCHREGSKELNKENYIVQLKPTGEEAVTLSTKLNLKGETKLKTKNGQEYGTITKVESSNGRTKLYIKSKYLVGAAPEKIVNNKTGEAILLTGDMFKGDRDFIKYIKETGEIVAEYNKELKNNDYTVSYEDHSKHYKMYSDDIFTIDVTK